MNALAPLPADFDVLDETAFEAGAGLAARATPIRAFAQIQECPERPELLRRTTRQEVLGTAPDRIELLGQQALP